MIIKVLLIGKALNSFSVFALLVLTVERFLALTYPFFHQTSVTKQRLIFLLVVLIVLPTVIVLSSSHFISVTILANVLSTISISVFLFLFIYFNYKMFIIARSKRDNETVAKSSNQERKRTNLQFKLLSTCSLVVICYFLC